MFKTKKQLKEEISRLEKENKSINQERLSLLKNRTINYEMLNMLKAIVLKTGLKEIEISSYLLSDAEPYNLYMEQSYIKDAKTLRLIKDDNIIKEDLLDLKEGD